MSGRPGFGSLFAGVRDMPVPSKVLAMADEAAPDAPRSEVLARENLRASHEDRDRAVETLRVAAGDGRLSAEELDERVERALTAQTYGELSALVEDLPGGQSGMGVAPKPKDLVRIDRYGASASGLHD